MMPGKHHTLPFLLGLTCGFFLKSDAASVSNVNLKIDVNGKTVIDQSYPTSKLFRFLLMVLYRNYTSVNSWQELHMIIFSSGIPKNAPKFMALDTESGPEPDWCKDMKVPEWCKKPGATRICYVTCPMAETGEPKWMALDTDSDPEPDWCKVVDCTKPGASQICHVTCPKEQFLVRPEKDSFWARMSKSGMKFSPSYMFYMQLQNLHL